MMMMTMMMYSTMELIELLNNRVVKPWNSLLNEVVTAPSVKAFEAKLDNFWKDQPVKFNYKEELRL